MSSNINWNVNLKDSGTIVARTKVGFMMVYLVYKNEGIYYRLSPLVENGGVLGGDAYTCWFASFRGWISNLLYGKLKSGFAIPHVTLTSVIVRTM